MANLYIKKVTGIENFPINEGYILLTNHNSAADFFCSALPLGIYSKAQIKFKRNLPINKRTSVIVRFVLSRKKAYFNLVYKVLFSFCRLFFEPITIFKDGAMEKCVESLNKGQCLIIFPEGLLNEDRKQLLKAKTGAARLALSTKVKVIPAGIINSERILPPQHSVIPSFHRMTVNIGEPIDLSSYYAKKDDPETIQHVTRMMMKRLGELCNKEYLY